MKFPKYFEADDKLRLLGAMLIFDGIYAQQRTSTAIMTSLLFVFLMLLVGSLIWHFVTLH